MDENRHYMNPQRAKHMSGEDGKEKKGGKKHPSIHIHSHAKGHTVHIMHPDGRHEMHEHGHGDTEGMKQHLDTHLRAAGQDHGEGGGEGGEAGDLMGAFSSEA